LNKLDALSATVAGIAGDTVFIKTKIGDLEVKLDTLLQYNTTLTQILNTLNEVKGDTSNILAKIGDLSSKVDEKARGAASYSLDALAVSIIVLIALIAIQFMSRKK